jgi:hypothetical protein
VRPVLTGPGGTLDDDGEFVPTVQPRSDRQPGDAYLYQADAKKFASATASRLKATRVHGLPVRVIAWARAAVLRLLQRIARNGGTQAQRDRAGRPFFVLALSRAVANGILNVTHTAHGELIVYNAAVTAARAEPLVAAFIAQQRGLLWRGDLGAVTHTTFAAMATRLKQPGQVWISLIFLRHLAASCAQWDAERVAARRAAAREPPAAAPPGYGPDDEEWDDDDHDDDPFGLDEAGGDSAEDAGEDAELTEADLLPGGAELGSEGDAWVAVGDEPGHSGFEPGAGTARPPRIYLPDRMLRFRWAHPRPFCPLPLPREGLVFWTIATDSLTDMVKSWLAREWPTVTRRVGANVVVTDASPRPAWLTTPGASVPVSGWPTARHPLRVCAAKAAGRIGRGRGRGRLRI